MTDEHKAPEEATLYDDIKASIKEEVRAELKAEFSRKGVSIPATPKTDDGNLTEFVRLVGHTAYQDGRREKALNTLANKYSVKTGEMVQGTDGSGGFLVPEEYHQELFSIPDMPLALLPRVTKLPMQTDVLRIPVYDQTVSPSNGSNAFNAGVSLAVVSEANAPASSTKPAFKQVALTAVKLLAKTQLSTELVDNSTPTATAIVSTALPKAVADYLEYSIINGSSPCAGIVGNAATIKVTRDTTASIKLIDLAGMYARFTGSNPVWVINKSCTLELFNLADANGNNIWLPNQNVAGSVGTSIFGAPVLFSQYNPVLGSEGDVMLVDGSAYLLGQNADVRLEASRDFAFDTDLITYRIAWRGNGKPMITAPIKLADGTYTVSPFVVLDDATS